MSDRQQASHPDIPTERTIDPFDRWIGILSGLPGGAEIKPATIQVIEPVVGRSDTFIVQSIRHEIGKKRKPGQNLDEGEPIFGVTQFVQRVSPEGLVRIVLPPRVSALLASQREAITTRIRKRAARQAVETRRERGDTLGNLAALKKARAKRGKKR